MSRNRFAAQRAAIGDGQDAIEAASALFVGMGGLGCPAALYLCRAGIGRATVVDPDVVELSNLPRQVLFRDGDVGRRKVEAARSALAPTPCAMHACFLDSSNAANLVEGHSIVLDGTDDPAARYVLDAACREAGVPWIHGSLRGTEGQVATFLPDGPAYADVFPSPPEPEDCAMGILGPVAGVIGTRMAVEAVRVLIGKAEPALHHYDALTGTWDTVRLSR